MANTLNNLIPDIYRALDVVSRELTGLIPSVTIDAEASRAAVGQTVRSFVAPEATALDITPSVTNPDNGDQTIGNVPITIQKSRYVPIRWSGEEELGVSSGPGASAIRVNQIAQAMRTLANEVETDLAGVHTAFSRAVGAAGTTPFDTAGDFTDAANALRVLKDNGAPGDNQLVMNTTAGVNLLGKQSRIDIQGADSFLRQGVLLPLNGINLRESAQIVNHVKGSATGALVNGALSEGDTAIAFDAATAGATGIKAGDVITFAADSDNQYVVTAGATTASGTITIGAPGLRRDIPDNNAITIVGNAPHNMAFSRSAIVLANRLPAMPAGGDSAEDVTTVTDPNSGLSFEVVRYLERRRVRWEIGTAWGANMVKPEHTALLLG